MSSRSNSSEAAPPLGANIAESVYAASRPDFLNKLLIALKEASESEYWIDLLMDTEYITEEEYVSLSGAGLPRADQAAHLYHEVPEGVVSN